VLGAGLLVVAACRHAPARAAGPDPVALADARETEQSLIAACAAALAAAPRGPGASRLTAQRDAHATHLAALGGGSGADVAPVPPTRGPSLLRSSAASLRAAAVAAVAGADAALLASIAASHEAMLEETRHDE
jgi:hypothetical protein